MKAAYIEQTGPPENIKVGDLPKPTPGPGQVLVRVQPVALNPIDLYIRSGHGGDAAGLPLRHRLRPRRDGRGGRPGRASGSRSATASGGRTRGCSAGRGWPPSTRRSTRNGSIPTPAAPARRRRPRPWPWSGSRRTWACSGSASSRPGETVYVPGGSGGVGSMVVQMAKAAGARVATSAGSPERLELCRNLGADLALNYKTDDVPARLREFAPEGVDVWYETQREPNLEVSIPLLRKRGRMILMAGRTAKPALPLGAFYPRELLAARLRHVQRHARGAAPCAGDIDPMGRGGPAQADRRPDVPARRRGRGREVPRGQHLGGAGTLTGKVVIIDRCESEWLECIAPVVASDSPREADLAAPLPLDPTDSDEPTP